MSLSDAGRQWRRRIATAAFLAAAALVSACTVQPVYGPTAGGGTVEATLARIDIDPVNTRIAQQVRNKLIFGLTGGGGVTNPVYRMKLVVTSQEIALGITREESAPVYSVIVSSTYEISRIDTGEIVLRATSRGTASYDRVNQIFANVRARVNAEDEAAGVVADDIRLRIAAATARGVI
jgi:LPS-assembly lipoprotein